MDSRVRGNDRGGKEERVLIVQIVLSLRAFVILGLDPARSRGKPENPE